MKKEMLTFLLFCLILLSTCSSVQQKNILQAIQSGVEKLAVSEAAPYSLLQAINNISDVKNKQDYGDIICNSCQIVVNRIIANRRIGANKVFMINYLNKLCRTFTDWGTVACQGYVDIEIDTILFIIDNKRSLTPERVCAIHFQAQKCIDPNSKKWKIDIPPLPEPDKNMNIEIKNETSVIKVLHLTDIHYDPHYQPGSNAVCDEPLCCEVGVPSDPKNAAGFWGDYNVCDMPRHSVDNLLTHIKEKHLKDIDFVYYTGDIISHKSWATSQADNTRIIKEIYELFAQTFKNRTVFPILGNHEPHPTDFYSSDTVWQSNLTTQWIFNLSDDEWSRWLPESTGVTIRKGGYYSVLVKPGFRIIGLNSNVCYTSNLWLVYEDEDPHQQLTWLVQELYKAEKRKEKVHILSHIPPGEILCHKQWSNQFRKIINRFSKVISAQFNGHTHVDELRVFYNPDEPNQVTNVAFNGASFTTFVGYNPNYRIYQVNISNAMVANYDQYIYNLTKANEKKTPPEWYKLYSFKEAYGLPDMQLDNFADLLRNMSRDYDVLWKYFRYLVRDSDVKIKEGCDRKCLKQLLCYITAVETNLSVNC